MLRGKKSEMITHELASKKLAINAINKNLESLQYGKKSCSVSP